MKRMLLAAALLLGAVTAPALAQDDPRIEASKSEGGLLIYGTSDPSAWAPLFEAFNAHYPWIHLEALNLGTAELLERYRAESATGTRTADILVAGAADKFVQASDNGELLAYDPVGYDRYPAFAHPLPDVITIAPEPMILIYNKLLVPEALWPTGFQDLANKVAENPDVFAGKIGTFEPVNHAAGAGVNIAMARALGEGYWDAFTKLAPNLRFETGAGSMLDKVTTGEYVVAYFPARFVVAPLLVDGREDIVGTSFFDDAQPFQLRSLGITRNTPNPNSAQLFVDFVLSSEGQRANAAAGNTPFDPSLEDIEGITSYQDVVEAIGGEDKITLYGYDREDIAAFPEYSARANQILGR